MKILILGKDGQVGRELQLSMAPFGQLSAYNRQQADLENTDELHKLVETERPDVIINAAAYTAVDKAESEPERAFRVNRDAVTALSDAARRQDSLLIHYSTDYVFDGNKTSPYLENDPVNPLSVYGASKHAGETAIEQSGCRAITFRTSWVYSQHGHNFLKTILRLAQERTELNIVADQIGSPTSAEWIADATALAVSNYLSGRLTTGLYHLTAAGATSWYEYAQLIVERALANGCQLQLDSSRIRPIKTQNYPLPALRPLNSQLDTSRLSTALAQAFPDWREHVVRTVNQLTTTRVSR